jgi:single-strand DNA-binding protein
MAGKNKWNGIGYLGANPEKRTTDSGKSVVNLDLGCPATFRDKDGNKQSITHWQRCTFWGKQADTIAEYSSKGSMIDVEGYLQTNKYEKDGATHYPTVVVVRDFQLLDRKPSGEPEEIPPRSDNNFISDDIPY